MDQPAASARGPVENRIEGFQQHMAVIDGGQFDPYTGEKLDWSLISRQRSAIKYAYVNDFLDTFALIRGNAATLRRWSCWWTRSTASATCWNLSSICFM